MSDVAGDGRPTPAADKGRRNLVRLAAGLSALFVVAAVSGGVLVFAAADGDPDATAQLEIGKWLLTLSAALAVGGVATVLLKFLEQRHAERLRDEERLRADRSDWGELLAQVVGVDETVARARQTLLAHRSARSYTTQNEKLLDARLTLRRVASDPLVVDASQQELLESLGRMRAYLDALGGEYEREYLPVSRQQKTDEVLLTAQATTAATDGGADGRGHEPTHAWRMLTDRNLFPVLGNLLDEREYGRSAFLLAYATAKERLEQNARIHRGEPYRPTVLPGTVEPDDGSPQDRSLTSTATHDDQNAREHRARAAKGLGIGSRRGPWYP